MVKKSEITTVYFLEDSLWLLLKFCNTTSWHISTVLMIWQKNWYVKRQLSKITSMMLGVLKFGTFISRGPVKIVTDGSFYQHRAKPVCTRWFWFSAQAGNKSSIVLCAQQQRWQLSTHQTSDYINKSSTSIFIIILHNTNSLPFMVMTVHEVSLDSKIH